MVANVNDLRYRRTEAAIRSAFMELVACTPVSAVTASALCRRAGISRNAFYLHHASVDALYAALIDEVVADVRAEAMASSRRVVATGDVGTLLATAIVEALCRHERLLRALLPSDDGSLAMCLAVGLKDAYVEAGLLLGGVAGGLEHRMSCFFAAWAHVGLVVGWVQETERPLAEVLPLFQELQMSVTVSGTRLLTRHRPGA